MSASVPTAHDAGVGDGDGLDAVGGRRWVIEAQVGASENVAVQEECIRGRILGARAGSCGKKEGEDESGGHTLSVSPVLGD